MALTRRELGLAALTMGVGLVAISLVTRPRREEVARTACYSNLRELGLGLMQYAQDYDDTLPRPWFGHDAGPSDAHVNYKWMDVVLPYVKSTALFNCPTDGDSGPYRERSGRSYGSYVMNNAYFAPGDAQTPPGGLKLSQIRTPSSTVLLLDGEGDFQFSWPDAAHTPAQSQDPFRWSSIRGRHGYGLHYNYTSTAAGCDGSSSTSLLTYACYQRPQNLSRAHYRRRLNALLCPVRNVANNATFFDEVVKEKLCQCKGSRSKW